MTQSGLFCVIGFACPSREARQRACAMMPLRAEVNGQRLSHPRDSMKNSEYEFVIVFECHLATCAAPVCISAGFNWGNVEGYSACGERTLKNSDKLNL